MKAFQLETPPIWAPVQMHMPTGGVVRPIIRFRMAIRAKWTGFMPTAVATGSSTGKVIRIAARLSMNMPTKVSTRLISRITRMRFVVMLRIAVATFCGMRSLVRMNANTFARPIRMIMEEQERMLV